MILSIWTLFVAITLSSIAGYYSVIGLATIFAAAPIPVIVMSASMEVAKVTAAVWLHRFWRECKWTMKVYLIFAVIVLCCITSMGVFGLLSKAHSDQGLASGNIAAQVDVIDEKIRSEKESVDSNRKALAQLDTGVNETIARSTSEKAIGRAFQLRKNFSKERSDLQKSIQLSQEKLVRLNDERAPLAAQMRQVEADVGPVRYIAAMVYGDNPDASTLERAVRWVIVMLVVVFDPLAITLVLAANESIRWTRSTKKQTATPAIDTTPVAANDAELVSQTEADDVDLSVTDSIVEIVSQSEMDNVELAITDDVQIVFRDDPVVELFDPDKVIEVNNIAVSSKEASKAWKRINPGKTLREQCHLMNSGAIDRLPWEDTGFIEENFSQKG